MREKTPPSSTQPLATSWFLSCASLREYAFLGSRTDSVATRKSTIPLTSLRGRSRTLNRRLSALRNRLRIVFFWKRELRWGQGGKRGRLNMSQWRYLRYTRRLSSRLKKICCRYLFWRIRRKMNNWRTISKKGCWWMRRLIYLKGLKSLSKSSLW